jgi:hypothetical protein
MRTHRSAFLESRVALCGEHLDARAGQAARLDPPLQDAETALAACHDLQDAELGHVPGRDARGAADVHRHGGRADFGALADQADAERRVLAQAGFRHVQVALLEEPQRQPPAREEHRLQREERDVGGGAHSRARPRWRTSTRQLPANAAASFSAR